MTTFVLNFGNNNIVIFSAERKCIFTIKSIKFDVILLSYIMHINEVPRAFIF